MTSSHQCPRPHSEADLLTVSEAVARLGIREADGRAWLVDRGLIRQVAGRDRVIWGRVLEVIWNGDSPTRATRGVEARVPVPLADDF